MSKKVFANKSLNDDVVLEQANANDDEMGTVLPLDDAEEMSAEGETPTILEPETEVGVEVLDQIIERTEPVVFSKYAGGKPRIEDFVVLGIEALQKTARGDGFDLGMKNDLPYVFNRQYWRQIDKAGGR